jgi:hypothetical protein
MTDDAVLSFTRAQVAAWAGRDLSDADLAGLQAGLDGAANYLLDEIADRIADTMAAAADAGREAPAIYPTPWRPDWLHHMFPDLRLSDVTTDTKPELIALETGHINDDRPGHCACPCSCPAPGQRDDDGTPGWCDSCRMNIHRERSTPRD